MGAGLPAMQTARTGRYTAAMPSRAGPLPQRVLASRGFSWSCITCGSRLACDAGGADWQVHRSDAIASKPAPTGGGGLASREFSWSCITCGSWLACDADGADWQVHRSDAIASKPAPTGAGWQAANSVGHALPVGAGLPAMQTARTGRYTAAMPSRASPLPQRFLASREFSWSCITCGSWLACDAGGADWQVHRSDAIASKPAPTGGGFRFIRSTKIPSGKKSARPNPAGAANRPAPAGR